MKRSESARTRLAIKVICQKDLKSHGAGGRTRTDMSLTSPDFESGAYTNFATPALGKE
jgi:hypothetical protein